MASEINLDDCYALIMHLVDEAGKVRKLQTVDN